MLKNGEFNHLKTWYHFFIFLLVIQIFFCVQFNNPVDPAFKGSYDFKVENFKSSDELSIFELYTLDINGSLGKDRYSAFSCYVIKDNVADVKAITGDTNRIQIAFYRPCTTDVVVKGIHPNGNIDERKFENVVVLNPYLINGRDTIAKNDTIGLSVTRSDSSKDISLLIRNIQWSDGKRNDLKGRDSTFTMQCDSAQSDSTLISATLLYNDTTSYTVNKKITFKGWSPRIKTTVIKSLNPNDTGNIISQTDSFKIKLFIDDRDSNTSKIEIVEGTKMIGSVKINKFSGTDSITLPPIMNPKVKQLVVRIFDKSGYTDSSEFNVVIKESAPQVFIKEMISIAYENSYSFIINSSINSTGFQWVLNDSILDTTLSGICKIPPLSIGTHTLKVTPLNKYNEKFRAGETKACVINAKEYNYWTIFKGYKDTINVKVNRLCTLAVAIEKNDTIINDTRVDDYLWPAGIDSNNITIKNTYAIFHFKDSIQPFMFNVNGVVNGDTADDAEITVVVRLNRPQFNIVDTLYESSVDNAVYLKYKAIPNSKDSTPVSSIYYRIPALGDSAIKYDSASGIRFNTIGDYIVEMWCVDRDSIKSIPDTALIEIYSDRPVISLKSQTIAVALNDSVTISGIQTKTSRNGTAIDSVLFDFNNDGAYDRAVKVGANNTAVIKLKPYTELATDSITIVCKDVAGNISLPVKQLINVFSNIPSIDSCRVLTSSTKYKSVPVDFKISITDPDDSLLLIKVFVNGVAFDSLGSVGNQDTISLKFNTAGTYSIQFIAIDKDAQSDTLSLAELLVVDEGVPVITAFNIKDSLTYIKDTIRCIPLGTDPNGTIKKYLYYINDKNSNPVDLIGDTLKYVFADSGKYVIYTRIIDNDTLSSAFAADTVVVRRGQPVVEKFKPDSSSVFVNTSVLFTSIVSDTNGRAVKREIKLNEKIIDSTKYGVADTLKKFTQAISREFKVADTGWNILKMRVLDDDSIYSEWKACSLYVNPGIPVINTISIDPSGVLYVRDTITLSVSVSDLNNGIDSVKVLWNNSGNYENMVLNTNTNKYQKGYRFKLADATITGIRIKVTDATGFFKDSLYSFSIRVGRPFIDSISPSEVWIKDTNVISIIAGDTNDISLDSFFIKFNSNESWRINTSASFNGIHFDDTNNVGLRQVVVKVKDKDSLWTEKNCNLNVKIGRPIVRQRANSPNDSIQWVSGSSGRPDTMFFRWTGGYTSIAVGDTDLNGNAVEFYWTWGRQGMISPSTLEPSFQRDGLILNDTNRLTVICKDNDSVRSNPYTFFVFPDGPPDTPIVSTGNRIGDSVTVKWVKAMDAKDQGKTQVQILVGYGLTAEPTIPLFNEPLPTVDSFVTDPNDNTINQFKFLASQAGAGKFRIKLIDKRGSTTTSVDKGSF